MVTSLADAMAQALNDFRNGKTLSDIQTETAYVWAGRALAAYHLYHEHGDVRALLDASEFAHEALEHASLTDDRSVLADLYEPLRQAHAEAVQLAVVHSPMW